MLDELASLRRTIEEELPGITSPEQLEQFRLRHLVRKGTLAALTDRLREVPKEDKPAVGRELNLLRDFVQTEFRQLQQRFEDAAASTPTVDVTLPGRRLWAGSVHPVRQTLREFISIFVRMGFTVAEGPDIEDDYHNFEALNFAPDHPARDMQDTFFVQSGDDRSDIVLRTHTSPVQVRVMKNQTPPIRSIMPGRVYRNEAINARSLAEFHQIEGLYIDKNVTLADLKGTLVAFARECYGSSVQYKFRPSYFPFTEPSGEMDITCFLCNGKGCRVCKHTGWLEIVGSGMVHPNVLRNCGIDPEVYSGFAFGFGIERVTLLRTGIPDIRLMYENDVRVLRQFA